MVKKLSLIQLMNLPEEQYYKLNVEKRMRSNFKKYFPEKAKLEVQTYQQAFRHEWYAALDSIDMDWEVLSNLSVALKNHVGFMLEAVTRRGMALAYGSASVKNNMRIVLTAMIDEPGILTYASENLQDNDRLEKIQLIDRGDCSGRKIACQRFLEELGYAQPNHSQRFFATSLANSKQSEALAPHKLRS